MANYRTCFNCAIDKSACPRRIALQDALAGHHVTSVKFRCPDRQPRFVAGQRVSFDWKYWYVDRYDENCLSLTFRGTVLAEKGPKFVIQVDHGGDADGEGIQASDVFRKNDALITKVRPDDMRAILEPNRNVCRTCYQIEGHNEGRCYRSQYYLNPIGCVSPKDAPIKEEEHPF